MERWTVTVPAPADWINSNSRLHRMQVAKLTAAWREAGRLASVGCPRFERAQIFAHVWKPRLGRYDPNNLGVTAKAVIDGMVTSGLLPDDDYKHLDGPDMRHGGKGPAALVLTITEVGHPLTS